MRVLFGQRDEKVESGHRNYLSRNVRDLMHKIAKGIMKRFNTLGIRHWALGEGTETFHIEISS
jgi:hypothetical protein